MLKCESFSLVVILICSSAICGQHLKHEGFTREKRTLVWPPGGSKLLVWHLVCFFFRLWQKPSRLFAVLGFPSISKQELWYSELCLRRITNFLQMPHKSQTPSSRTLGRRGRRRGGTCTQCWDAPWKCECKSRSASGWFLLIRRGFVGKSCVLRTICEVAATPLEKNFGLFHELIHTVFT